MENLQRGGPPPALAPPTPTPTIVPWGRARIIPGRTVRRHQAIKRQQGEAPLPTVLATPAKMARPRPPLASLASNTTPTPTIVPWGGAHINITPRRTAGGHQINKRQRGEAPLPTVLATPAKMARPRRPLVHQANNTPVPLRGTRRHLAELATPANARRIATPATLQLLLEAAEEKVSLYAGQIAELRGDLVQKDKDLAEVGTCTFAGCGSAHCLHVRRQPCLQPPRPPPPSRPPRQ